MKKPPQSVPCNGCTLCCKCDALRLLPGDDPKQYETEPHPTQPGALMLAHKENGDCFYLTDTGCGIHARRPRMCRTMDCRLFPEQISYHEARALHLNGRLNIAIWFRGLELASKPRR